MKTVLFFLMTLIFCFTAHAAELTFKWDAYTGQADGLIFYWSAGEEVFHKQLPITDTIFKLDAKYLKPESEYSFWLTAYSKGGESDKSNIVNYTKKPFNPPADNLPTSTYNQPPRPKMLNLNI